MKGIPFFRAGLGLGCGALVALALGWGARAPRAGLPGPTAFWCSDREADRVLGLDERLIKTTSTALESPLLVAPRPDGGAWVVQATAAGPLGPHGLARLDPNGSVVVRAGFSPLVDLDVTVGGDAVVAELGSSPGALHRVWRVDRDGRRRLVAALAGVYAVAARGDEVLVGDVLGRLWLFDTSGPPTLLATGALGGEIGDLERGPTEQRWWALEVSGGGRVALLDDDLNLIWAQSTGLSALHLAAVPHTERVWVVSSVQPRARRYGPGGALELTTKDLPLSGLDRASARAGGGLFLVAPGAILGLDRWGEPDVSQGGFDFLIDLAAVRRAPTEIGVGD